MSPASDRLYNLLPVIYRLRDSNQGQPLRALLGIIDGELATVEADITSLYENWFIETSDDWVVPYIGDLLGVRGINNIESATGTGASVAAPRAYVANTLYYRRRKGTAFVLSALAADVTGWPAHVVEFFELLQTTQYLNHRRLFNTTPDLRDTNRLNLLDTALDSLPHTADVRHIQSRRGKHNIANVGIFLWRLQNYPVEAVQPRQAQSPHAYGYHFSPLGNPAPLFNIPTTPSQPQITTAQPENSLPGANIHTLPPAPIRPLDFLLDLKNYQEKFAALANPPANSRYYGPQRSLQVIKDGVPVPPKDIVCKNLVNWAQPPAGKVAIDVLRGRLAFATGEEPAESLKVSYNYGFSADIGGGPYDRRDRIAEIRLPIEEFAIGAGKAFVTLADALTAWDAAGKPPAVVRIYDSASYDANISIDLPADGSLVIDCENEERPTLLNAGPIKITSAAASAEQTPALTLNGLLIEGRLEISGKLNLRISDCTLVPGLALDEDGYPKFPELASLKVTGTDVVDTLISISCSIMGPVEMPEECQGLILRDSILNAPLAKDASTPSRAALASTADGIGPGPVTILERVTVFGQVHVKELELASEVIFTGGTVIADRRQTGCVRFSSIPAGSKTPRRYRCQPDLAIETRQKELDPQKLTAAERKKISMRVRPQFTSLRYGLPAFLQISNPCADEIKTGAEDGSEMGVFSLLKQPQRLNNLQIALDEYLRFGLEAGIFFVT